MVNKWIPSKDEWENHQDSILQTFKSICNVSSTKNTPSSTTTGGWSRGLITVTIVSVLLILFICV